MAYAYLIGTGIYAIIWFVFFSIRKDLRKKLFISSLIAAPLGITEKLFIPSYWIPQFQTIPLFREVFLEDFLFSFFLGGVVSILYQFIFKEKEFKFKPINPLFTLIAPLLFLPYFFNMFGLNIMHYSILSMLIGGGITLFFLGRGIYKKVFLSAIINTLFSLIVYLFLANLFPSLSASYQIDNLFGILFMGIPVEEFLWFFSFSIYWTPIYEIWKNYFKKKRAPTEFINNKTFNINI